MVKKVLVVDDSMIMRTVIKEIINSAPDLEVVGEAENGDVALKKQKELKPDLIVLDIEMPVMNGIDCLKRLKLTSSAKVIIVSSVAQMGSDVATEARRLGAADIIAKPSGAMSLDLKTKTGHEITQAARKAVGLA